MSRQFHTDLYISIYIFFNKVCSYNYQLRSLLFIILEDNLDLLLHFAFLICLDKLPTCFHLLYERIKEFL